MAIGDLSTTATVREYLAGNVPVPLGDEALLAQLVTDVSVLFVSEAGRPILTADYIDTFDGSDATRIYLLHYPAIGVDTVSVDGVEIPERSTVSGSGWVLSDAASGRLDLVGGYSFAAGIANCAVAYSAGYGATAPADVSRAVVDQVAYLYRMKDRVGVANESTQGGGSVSYLGSWQAQQGKAGQTPGFAAAVARYRRVG